MRRIFIYFLFIFSSLGVLAESFSPQVIKIYDEDEVMELEEQGVNILRRRGNILLCLVPTDDNNEIVIPNSVRKVSRPAPKTPKGDRGFSSGFNFPTLDVATSHYDASDIIYGKGFEHPYTGKGIVVGICDIGFDPLHPTFLDAERKSRVKRVTQYIEREGIRLQLEGDEQYKEWKTDDPDKYHATHVCGILTGNGAGTPYVGIARDADIVVSTSTLSDVGLLAGVEDIIDYAKETGKRAVINLSMGNYTGAHDGTSLFSQYLDLCADDAIIVLSSGNEGTKTNYLTYTFSEEKNNVGFRLGNSKWNQIQMYGMTDIWGLDDSPLSLEISIYDDGTHEVLYTYPPFNLENYDVKHILWNPDDPILEGCPLDGYMMVTSGINPENNRRQAILLYDFDSPEKVEKGWARYVIAVKIIGQTGKTVDIFADGTYTRLMTLSGNPAPNSTMSVSDLACGHRTISVGMYGNRAIAPVSTKDDVTGKWTIVEEEIGIEPLATINYSSYGTLRDGRILPLTLAPGYLLMSSISRHYLEANPDTECLRLDAPWVLDGGTSMSSPYVAGFIATWLEAYPDLTVEEIMRIISYTNRTDIPEPDDPHNANGYFDPLSALTLINHEASIGKIVDESEGISPNIEIYDLSGMKVHKDSSSKRLRKKAKGNKIIQL